MKTDDEPLFTELATKTPLSPLRYPSLQKARSEKVNNSKQAPRLNFRTKEIPEVISFLLNRQKFNKSPNKREQQSPTRKQPEWEYPDLSLKAIHLSSQRMTQPQIQRTKIQNHYQRSTVPHVPQKDLQINTLTEAPYMRSLKQPLTPAQPSTIVRRNVNRKKILESIPRSKMSNNVKDYLSVEKVSIKQMEDSLLSKRAQIRQYRLSNLLQFNGQQQQNQIDSYHSEMLHQSNSPSPQPKKKSVILKKIIKFKPSHQLYYYRDFMWKIGFSNDFVVANVQEYEGKLKVFIGGGNNSKLIKSIIKRRPWWAITEKLQEANLIWTQLKITSIFFSQSKGEITKITENQTVDKLTSKQKQTGYPFFNKQEQQKWKKYWENNIDKQRRMKECFKLRSKILGIQQFPLEQAKTKIKIHNHFLNNFIIGNKKALFQTMSEFYSKIGKDVFDYLPLTFHIKKGLEDDQYLRFCQSYYTLGKAIKQDPNHLNKFNAWIVKPGQNTNRGNGIIVCLEINEIKAILKRQERHADGTLKTYILQKYIEKPLLYKRRKFDLRHYMMINCSNGRMKGYWYREGYVRTTSAEYTLKQSSGGVHLTNDAVQKFLPDYGKFEKGNKIFYEDLEAYIKKQDPKFDFYKAIYPKMKAIATDIIRASALNIDPVRRVNNFEIFGLDFMVDANYQVWLIEVNTNPCLETTCPVLAKIIPQFIESTLQVCVDPIFSAPLGFKPKYQPYLGQMGESNGFELVFDERVDGVQAVGESLVASGVEEQDDLFDDDGESLGDD